MSKPIAELTESDLLAELEAIANEGRQNDPGKTAREWGALWGTGEKKTQRLLALGVANGKLKQGSRYIAAGNGAVRKAAVYEPVKSAVHESTR